jgi:hypothetical protein
MIVPDFDTVVVVAARDPALLRQSLPKMRKWPVLVVDTGAMIPEVEAVCDEFDNTAYLLTPYKGYDTGAYLWAYWTVRARNYLFMQDSCCPREDDFVEQFARAMPAQHGAVGWSSFDINVWDSDAQCTATQWMYGRRETWPAKGIFGPIFYTNRKSLMRMGVAGLLPMPPVHKEQQQAMERAWAILFHRAGMRVNFLVDEDMPRGYAMERGEYPALTKTFRMRA